MKKITATIIISVFTVSVVTLSALLWTSNNRIKTLENNQRNIYMHAIDDLAENVDTLDSLLTKSLYSGDADMFGSLTSEVWHKALVSKDNLSLLPANNNDFLKTYKLLSQVGDYAKSLSEKFRKTNKITAQERETILTLKSLVDNLSDSVYNLQNNAREGIVSLSYDSSIGEKIVTANTMGNFAEIDANLNSYPKLIYDGPFSDHLIDKEPIVNVFPPVNAAEAKNTASVATGLPIHAFMSEGDEVSNMPLFVMYSDKFTVGVSKFGGKLCYLINGRAVTETSISKKSAIKKAKDYLSFLGYRNMKESYYELADNVLTINFAYTENNVLFYPDLINVTVALDNGEIINTDARTYLMNHRRNKKFSIGISEKNARKKLSPILDVIGSKLVVIPTNSEDEKFCYEFNCIGDDGENILVYINAENGTEENIFIVMIGADGTLVE